MSDIVFGGFQPCSFIDFPGRVSAVLFTIGCNLRCPFCHNPQLVDGPTEVRIDEEEVFDYLERRQGQVGGVVVSGGEPTLHGELPAFLRRVKNLGYAVKLDSNGSRPEMIGRCMEQGLIDYLALDHKLPAARLHELGGSAGAIAESRRLAQAVPHEFRSTLTPDLHDAQCLAAMAEELPVGSPWVLQRFRPGDVLDPDRCSRAPAIDYLDAAVQIGQKRGLVVRLR